MQGQNDYVDVFRAFGIEQNYSARGLQRTRSANFLVRDINTIVSLEYGISCLTGSCWKCQIEIFAVIGKSARHIPVSRALQHICAYGVAVNFLDSAPKHAIGPAEVDRGARPNCRTVCSALVPRACFECENNLVWLDLNNRPAMEATLGEMAWPIPEIVSLLSDQLPLRRGDLVFTGSPSPSLSVNRTDILRGGVEGLSRLSLRLG
ncbi:fumarylacetoacetate hydrolase family protein [Trinickia sp. NRRL B-1857]|uniref:fumarylacetoacetate hydrolase family protein n=1 Tax=Trinickia sp. NRRL B-1857 TaxID=3162879 RepID=UPI003D2B26EE